MDVETLSSLLKILDEDSLRAARVAEALEQFTLIVDFEQEKEARSRDYRKARAALEPVLSAVNGSTTPVFSAIGNAHLDLAWLWPMAETYRKTARTFAAQLRLMEEYQDYKFIQSQPACYEMCRQYYPELFEEIRKAVKKANGLPKGHVVEPDTNMAGGEALIRQLLYGKAYYKKNVCGGQQDALAAGYLWLHRSASSDPEKMRCRLSGYPEDFLVLQRGRTVPLPLFYLERDGRQ